MIKTVVPLLLFSSIAISGNAGGEWIVAGARFTGMSGISAAFGDTWAVLNNPAGIAWEKKISAGIFYGNRFLLKELSDKAVAVSLPFRVGTVGFVLVHHGFSLYNEMTAGACFARKFGKSFSAGIRIDYLRIHTGDIYGNRNLVTCAIGLQYAAGKNLLIGMNLRNPVPVVIYRATGERLPVSIRLGLSWNFSRNGCTGADIEKVIGRKPCIRAGFEYFVARPLRIRIGIGSEPVSFSIGMGLETGGLRFDISSSYHMSLGFSPQASLSWIFK